MKLGKWLNLIKWKIASGSKRSKEAATLGVMPDYGYSEEGMRMNSISAGKTAEKFGFQKNDIVVKIGDHDVKDLIGYMSVMQNYNVGDMVDVKLLREGSELKVAIEFM